MRTLSLPAEPNPPSIPPHSQAGLGHADACFICLNNTLDDTKTISFSAPLPGMVYGFPLIFLFFEINICRAWKPIYFPPKCLSSGSFGFVFFPFGFFPPFQRALPKPWCFLKTSHPRLSLPWLCSLPTLMVSPGLLQAPAWPRWFPLALLGCPRFSSLGFQQDQVCLLAQHPICRNRDEGCSLAAKSLHLPECWQGG